MARTFTVEDAWIYTLPDAPPPVHVAVNGSESLGLAAQASDGMVATQSLPELTQAFERPPEVASRSCTTAEIYDA
jgi:alkanesulfonate monooxygenase SsuD/methylene tetrahydromethanopterin reductase-like flavin-dependent oxidoreductase (luciferase family)